MRHGAVGVVPANDAADAVVSAVLMLHDAVRHGHSDVGHRDGGRGALRCPHVHQHAVTVAAQGAFSQRLA